MNVYFVRHGESYGNLHQLHQGENESLTSKGIIQAHSLAKRLKKLQIHAIYASPYIRSKQTAEIISRELGLSVEYWEQLKELKLPSEIEGLSYLDSVAQKIKTAIKTNQNNPDWKYSDGESYNNLLTRAKDVERHLLLHHQNQNVLCLSHIKIIFMIIMQIIMQDKLTPEIFWQFYYHSRQQNTGITHLEYSDKSGWYLVTWNNTTHV